MSVLKSRIFGFLMFLVALAISIWYTLCVFVNGSTSEGLVFFRESTFFGIPLLNEYWTIALPLYLLVIVIQVLVGWLGIAALLTGEPQVSEEEMRMVRELDKNYRKK